MSSLVVVGAIILCALGAAAVSRRIESTIITLPIIFTGLGLLLSGKGLGVVTLSIDSEVIRIIAELTLVLVLATDAARINLRRLYRDHNLPVRLLAIGLPLTMVAGTALAGVLFAGLPFWEAVIIGVILSPTDASLGMAVVTNPLIPVRIRQSLNIESGLNDGIAMPFLLMAISFALADESNELTYWVAFGARQIIFGALGGIVIGYIGSRFVLWGAHSRWMTPEFQKISAILLSILAYVVASLIGGNGFIAAFASGMVSGNREKGQEADELREHADVQVQLLMMLTFMIVFGAVMLPAALEQATGRIILYAVLSLTLVRMLPVAISMLGEKVAGMTVAFVGWFGPRGTASILYLFTVFEEEGLQKPDLIYTVVLITVFMSVVLHGVTAVPGTNLYCRHLPQRVQADSPEMGDVSEMPVRASRPPR